MCRMGCWKRQKRRCKCTRNSHFNWWLCSFFWWYLAKSFKICGKGETQIIYKKDVEAKYQRRKIYSASKNKSTWKYNLFRPTKGINLDFTYILRKVILLIDYSEFDTTNVNLFFVKVGIVAANLSVSNGDIHHYRLSVSVIPSNIDVWGWEKWYKPESAKIEAKDVRRLIVGPLLKADPKHLNEIDMKPRIDHGKKK